MIAKNLFALYRNLLMPILVGLGAQCRFQPSCSCYAQAAIEHYGWLKGTVLALKRLLRCQPFCHGGNDSLCL